MGEVVVDEEMIPHRKDMQQQQHHVNISIPMEVEKEMKEQEDGWLPITDSGNGNVFSSTFHLLCSGLGFQALLLPYAFSSLGWTWGIICLSIAYIWQLYTIWLLVHLHESNSGIRYIRFLHLSIASFGVKMGKLLAIFPVMYLSGGTCVMLIITGGGAIKLFCQTVSGDGSSPLTGTESFLIFTCIAIVVAQLRPNLNSLAGISFIGAITAVVYYAMLWLLSINKSRPQGVLGVSYDRPGSTKSEMACGIMNGIGIIALAFRGHNVVLEIQGAIPSSPKRPSHKPMWKGVTISYVIIGICLFSLAIGGFWAYGNKIPANGLGILSAFYKYHGQSTSKFVMGLIYILVLTNSLSSFQIYAIPVFYNLDLLFSIINKKNKLPSWVVHHGIRLLFGGLVFFIAVTFPFLPSLAGVIGGLALPLTYVYPCLMWIAMKKPNKYGAVWCLNIGLSCLGYGLSVVCIGSALWNLVNHGLHANFFKP